MNTTPLSINTVAQTPQAREANNDSLLSLLGTSTTAAWFGQSFEQDLETAFAANSEKPNRVRTEPQSASKEKRAQNSSASLWITNSAPAQQNQDLERQGAVNTVRPVGTAESEAHRAATAADDVPNDDAKEAKDVTENETASASVTSIVASTNVLQDALQDAGSSEAQPLASSASPVDPLQTDDGKTGASLATAEVVAFGASVSEKNAANGALVDALHDAGETKLASEEASQDGPTSKTEAQQIAAAIEKRLTLLKTTDATSSLTAEPSKNGAHGPLHTSAGASVNAAKDWVATSTAIAHSLPATSVTPRDSGQQTSATEARKSAKTDAIRDGFSMLSTAGAFSSDRFEASIPRRVESTGEGVPLDLTSSDVKQAQLSESEVAIEIASEKLGAVKLRVVQEADGLKAHVVTASEAAANTLRQDLQQVLALVRSSGVNLESFTVASEGRDEAGGSRDDSQPGQNRNYRPFASTRRSLSSAELGRTLDIRL